MIVILFSTLGFAWKAFKYQKERRGIKNGKLTRRAFPSHFFPYKKIDIWVMIERLFPWKNTFSNLLYFSLQSLLSLSQMTENDLESWLLFIQDIAIMTYFPDKVILFKYVHMHVMLESNKSAKPYAFGTREASLTHDDLYKYREEMNSMICHSCLIAQKKWARCLYSRKPFVFPLFASYEDG